jgi:hypothetical protein
MAGIPLLGRYREQPFNEGTRIDYIDQFLGTGVDDTFTLTKKSGTEVGNSAQVETVLFPRFTNAMVIDGDDVILNSAPLLGQNIVVPGVESLNFGASDQDDALGRMVEIYAFIADVDSIHEFAYDAPPLMAGIKMEFVKLIPATIPAIIWFQLAPANADGTVGTYEAAGAPLFTAPIKTSDVIVGGPYLAGTTSFDVVDGTNFLAGDYIILNRSNPTEEIVKILSISFNTLTHTGTTFDHFAAETVLTAGRKFWIKMTVPLNATTGNIMNFYSISLKTTARILARP